MNSLSVVIGKMMASAFEYDTHISIGKMMTSWANANLI